MDLYLVKDKRVTFPLKSHPVRLPAFSNLVSRGKTIPVDLVSLKRDNKGVWESVRAYCETVTSFVHGMGMELNRPVSASSQGSRGEGESLLPWIFPGAKPKLTVTMGMYVKPFSPTVPDVFTPCSQGFVPLTVWLSDCEGLANPKDGFLARLKNVCEPFRIQMKLTNCHPAKLTHSSWLNYMFSPVYFTSDFPLKPVLGSHGAYFVSFIIQIPKLAVSSWIAENEYVGNLTIKVELSGGFLTHQLSSNKKILDDGVASDFEIIAKSGTRIKCHKRFLLAQSKVFAQMLTTDCLESRTNAIAMPDMSAVSVREFLYYLYVKDFSDAAKTATVSLDLLKIAYKYKVEKLKKLMVNSFMSRIWKWTDVEVAMELFFYAKTLPPPVGEKLKNRAFFVMTCLPGSLRRSKGFRRLLKEDPDAAGELMEFAMKASKKPIK